MALSDLTHGRAFRGFSILVAAATGFMPCSLGISAIGGSIGDKLKQLAREHPSHYTVAPGKAYLGKNPGRDPGRGMWTKQALQEAEQSANPILASLDPEAFGGGLHTLAVSAASGGAMPWEGSAPSPSGAINTGNGNKLTELPLVAWKSYGMTVDFTVYQNSQSNYADELGAGWTTSSDIYINNLTGNPVVHYADGTSIPYTAHLGSYTTPAGIYDKLVKNTGSTWTVTRKDGSKIQFNSSGYMTSQSDRNGNTISYTLNSGFYCTKITGPDGKYLTINLNGSNQITSISDPLGNTWSFTINGSNDLTNIAWPAIGGTTYNDQFAYTAHAITSHTDRRGKVWSATYNSTDNSVASETDPLSHTWSYSYASTATTITDPLSNVRTDNYSSGILASSEDESSYSESYTARDSNYNVETLVDKNSKTWTMTWDSSGNKLTQTDPLSHETVWTFNSFSEPLTKTDALSHETQWTYDSNGNLLTTVDPLSHTVVTNTYDSYGELLTSKDGDSNETQFSYTSGTLSSVEDALTNTKNIGVDGMNRVTSVTDPLTHEEQTSLDAWGRVVTITHTDSTTVSKSYSPTSVVSRK